MKIFINPGHSVAQGEDPGTCHFGLREADIALSIGQLVADYLTSAGCQVKVFQYDGLGEICNASNFWGSDLFVSIHCNSATNPTACGTETFCVYGAGAGRKLAQCVQSQIVNNLPVVDRGVQERGFAVLTGTTCPAILIETAFLSNKVDAELLKTRQDDFARAIARGVTDYLVAVQPKPDVVDAQRCPTCGQLKP